jgi:predicted porin
VKKNLIAIAVGTAFAMPGIALADAKVYGKFNIALDNQKDEIGIDFKNGSDDRSWKLRDSVNSSRVGVKGKEALGIAGLEAFYKMEWGVDPDGSESETFSERNIFVGLQGGFGAIQIGKYDTLIKEAGTLVDVFNDTPADIKSLMSGETRDKNQIQYTTPKLADAFSAAVAIQPGEGRTALDDSADTEDGLADTIYAALMYESPMFDAALAYASNQATGLTYDADTAGADILRVSGAFKLQDLTVGALYQIAEGIDQNGSADNANGGDGKESSLLLSATYTLSAVKLKVMAGQTDGDNSDLKRTEMALGVDYKLSKSATMSVYYTDFNQEQAAGGSDLSTDTYGTALIYSF